MTITITIEIPEKGAYYHKGRRGQLRIDRHGLAILIEREKLISMCSSGELSINKLCTNHLGFYWHIKSLDKERKTFTLYFKDSNIISSLEFLFIYMRGKYLKKRIDDLLHIFGEILEGPEWNDLQVKIKKIRTRRIRFC